MADLPGEVPPAPAGERRGYRWWLYAPAAVVVTGLIAAAMVISADAGRTPFRVVRDSPSSATLGGCTEQLTLTASDGRMSGCVRYLYGPGGSIVVRSVEASFTSASGQALPFFTFTFRDPASGKIDYQFTTDTVYANTVTSHSTRPIMLGASSGARNIRPGDVLDITLHALAASGAVPHGYTVATISLSLNRGGLRCPSSGHAWENRTPAC